MSVTLAKIPNLPVVKSGIIPQISPFWAASAASTVTLSRSSRYGIMRVLAGQGFSIKKASKTLKNI